MKNKELLIQLINEYLTLAKEFCHLLEDNYQSKNLLNSWKTKKIPMQGVINNKINFQFHGIGCLFENDEIALDLDFGQDGNCQGFDLWRIRKFLQNKKYHDKYRLFLDEKLLTNEFNKLEQEKIIYCPKMYPSPHLYYLKSDPLHPS